MRAWNSALRFLKKVDLEGTRRPDSELDILFHRCDPMDLTGMHAEPPVPSKRKPDLILTSLRAAKRVADRENNESWSHVVTSYAPNPPHQHFRWFDIMGSVELKFLLKIDPNLVKLLFNLALSHEMPKPVPPQPDILERFSSKKRAASSVSSMSLPSSKRLKTLGM